ncbi:MAG: xanthine dehydrogenase family protein subunit M [Acidimicrobiia bacterium]
MYPREFEYVAAGSVAEAAQLLADNPGAKVLSGGMSLIPMMKLRLLSPEMVVDIGRISGLDRIEDKGDHVAIGALVRQDAVAASDLVPTALRTASSQTGDVQVRGRGTLAGAIAHADVAADTPTAVLALGATMVAQSASGTREIAADDFFVDTLTSALEPDEILTEIRVPKRGGGSAYDKLGRRGGHTDYAVAGVAAWVADAGLSDVRVAINGVGTKPTLAVGVMEALRGGASPEEAAGRATEGITVLEDLYGSEEYKAHLAKVFTKRAVEQAIANAS